MILLDNCCYFVNRSSAIFLCAGLFEWVDEEFVLLVHIDGIYTQDAQ